jgi:hypothetical protein
MGQTMKKSFQIIFALSSALAAFSYGQTENTVSGVEPKAHSAKLPHFHKRESQTQFKRVAL